MIDKHVVPAGVPAFEPRLKPRLGICRSSGICRPVYGQVPSREFTRDSTAVPAAVNNLLLNDI